MQHRTILMTIFFSKGTRRVNVPPKSSPLVLAATLNLYIKYKKHVHHENGYRTPGYQQSHLPIFPKNVFPPLIAAMLKFCTKCKNMTIFLKNCFAALFVAISNFCIKHKNTSTLLMVRDCECDFDKIYDSLAIRTVIWRFVLKVNFLPYFASTLNFFENPKTCF